MDNSDIVVQRLFNQGLSTRNFRSTAEVVGHFGALQAQDFPAAKWSLGVRIQNSTDSVIEKEFNEGKILRTHILRPTWHFVLPEDLVWMQELTSAKVKAQVAHYNRKLELTDEVFAKATKLIVKALEGKNYLTRQQLKIKLKEELGIETDVQRLAHLIFWPELDSLVCSGPLRLRSGQARGGQFTYALVSERVPRMKKFSRENFIGYILFQKEIFVN